jgi:HEAT repeat protein
MLIKTRKTWLGLGALAIFALVLIAGAQQALADASQQMRTVPENKLADPGRSAQHSQDTLIAGLGSQDLQQRRQAAYRLGELGSNEALSDLVASLKAEDEVLRRIAAKSLGKIGDPKVVSVLNALMQDAQASIAVRCAAACALGMIGGQQAQEALSCACNQLGKCKNIQQRRLRREISRAKEASKRLDG